MNIFSLAHLNELAKQLPDPKAAVHVQGGHRPVIRLPITDGIAVSNPEHPGRSLEAHANAYVEFEILMWKDVRGVSSPRWVLRGLVAV